MAGDEIPRKRRGPEEFSRAWWLQWILLVYTIWGVVVFLGFKPDPQIATMIGVGLVGLAVIATRPRDQRD